MLCERMRCPPRGTSGGKATAATTYRRAESRARPIDRVAVRRARPVARPAELDTLCGTIIPNGLGIVRRILIDHRLTPAHRIIELHHVPCRRIGGGHAVHDAAAIGADVDLHPEVPLIPILGLPHFGIPGVGGVLRRARRADDRHIHDRPPAQQHPLRAQLADLKMPGALQAVDDILRRVDSGELAAATCALLGSHIALRNRRRLLTPMRAARLPAIKTPSVFDFTFRPSLKRDQIDSLYTLAFLERKEQVVFLGLADPISLARRGAAKRSSHPTASHAGISRAHGRRRAGHLPISRTGAMLFALFLAHESPLRACLDDPHEQQELRGMA